VAGWDWHQTQQRARLAAQVVQVRQADVKEFYTTDDVARARELIDKYEVEWVIVGSVERAYYPASGLAKFQDGIGGRLELAYENPRVQIFHVIPEEELQATAGR
jgi:uncharacterized membrane protein